MKAYRNSIHLIVVLALFALCGASAQAVPTLYFLTTSSSSATINDAVFMPFNPATATGTGNFDSFLRIQGNGTERGYNTDGTVQYQTKSGIWTHSLTLTSTLPPRVEMGGNWYREILLDLDEDGGPGRYLSFDQLVVSLEASPNLTGYPDTAYQNFGGPVIYSMDDLGQDSAVIMDSLLFGGGSGKGDVRIRIPDFSPNPSFPYLYVYAVFGQQTSVQLPTGETVEAVANSGFEEMGVWVGGTPEIPAPGALLLAVLGAGLAARLRRVRVL
jgi:hypothetical protein